MPRTSTFCPIILMLSMLPAMAARQEFGTTVLDGVYSEAQAARGQSAYRASCGACHGDAGEGVSAPTLAGDRFIERWRDDTLVAIYGFIRERMPPRSAADAGALTDADYLDILTHILNMNEYRSGDGELTAELLGSVMLVGPDGPRPVPDGAHVLAVGCLSRDAAGRWVLSNSTEPVRTPSITTSTPAELEASSLRSLGSQVFRLVDMEAVFDFEPEEHEGHKIQAKGYIVRQPNAERIGLSAMEMLDVSCEQ